jgi:hypothetical protein
VCDGWISIIVARCYAICDNTGWLLGVYSHVGASDAGLSNVLHRDGEATRLGVARRVASLISYGTRAQAVHCNGQSVASD